MNDVSNEVKLSQTIIEKERMIFLKFRKYDVYLHLQPLDTYSHNKDFTHNVNDQHLRMLLYVILPF